VGDDRGDGAGPVAPPDRELQLQERQRSHERVKLLGLLVIVFFILVLAFVRFGKHIPWGAR
jgi:hypothetical protein